MLRIVGGAARGCRLFQVPGDVVRPATDRLRESLFALLEADLEGARVLDLFAGSGALGLEALSRGAAGCVFVERDREALDALERNVAVVGLPARSKIVPHDLSQPLPLEEKFDVAFLDPPFVFLRERKGKELLRRLVEDLARRLIEPGGLVVFRYEKKDEEAAENLFEGYSPLRKKKYGRSRVMIFQFGEPNDS